MNGSMSRVFILVPMCIPAESMVSRGNKRLSTGDVSGVGSELGSGTGSASSSGNDSEFSSGTGSSSVSGVVSGVSSGTSSGFVSTSFSI